MTQRRLPTLYIPRGLPASGKSRWARRLQDHELKANGRQIAIVGRDRIRDQLHGARTYTEEAERQVTLAQQAQAEALLHGGVDVIVDDMNLRAAYVKAWLELALRCGAEWHVEDRFLDVALETCILRDSQRDEHEQVGEGFIRKMHSRYLARKSRLPIPTVDRGGPAAVVPYFPAPGLPEVMLCDIDGTVALMRNRSPYDMTRVGEDVPNPSVIRAVRAMHAAGVRIVFCSGRDESARPATEKWLAEHVAVPYLGLHMRAVGDSRKDSLVKREIFEREIRQQYAVVGVFDDRQQVVRMWRELGLTVFQVAEGAF